MILSIVTNEPQWVLENLEENLSPQWEVKYCKRINDCLHEYEIVPDDRIGTCLCLGELLEIGVPAWNIRIHEPEIDNEQ